MFGLLGPSFLFVCLCFEYIAHIAPPRMSVSVTVVWVIGDTGVHNVLSAFLKGVASESRSPRLDLFVVTPDEYRLSSSGSAEGALHTPTTP